MTIELLILLYDLNKFICAEEKFLKHDWGRFIKITCGVFQVPKRRLLRKHVGLVVSWDFFAHRPTHLCLMVDSQKKNPWILLKESRPSTTVHLCFELKAYPEEDHSCGTPSWNWTLVFLFKLVFSLQIFRMLWKKESRILLKELRILF